MKAVIFAGGLGTRIMEESARIPKPMVMVGGRPILWHIMKFYSAYGINDFIICLGYKGYVIKEYFYHYFMHNSDMSLDLKNNKVKFFNNACEDWNITLVETGEHTMTGGRLKRVAPYLEPGKDDTFLLTYGDGVCNVNIQDEIKFHHAHGKLATILAVRPSGRFGAIEMDGAQVQRFVEKPRGDGGFINGGYFVLNRKVIELIDGDETVWENEPLETLVARKELMAFEHEGFWSCMDTLKDANTLNALWESKEAKWRIWDEKKSCGDIENKHVA